MAKLKTNTWWFAYRFIS